jgi:hypothetical protein
MCPLEFEPAALQLKITCNHPAMTSASPPPKLPPGIDVVAAHGWKNNLRICNGTVELMVTLDVGPRILSYRTGGGFNPLKVFEDQVETTGEAVWRNRGGHRLWIAPEDKVTTYFPDNAPVAWEKLGELRVKLTPPPETTTGFQKEIEITLDASGTGVTLLHRITRIAATPAYLSPWALTVMAAGGIAVMPQPELGQHPRDLLPNRNLVLWPYTDMSDARWRFGRKYILLKQEAAGGPTKIGLSHAQGWSGYLVGGVFFLKRYSWNPEMIYPDNGCNFETFTNARMLELESLGPLRHLEPQQSLEHVEHWELHAGPNSLDMNDPEGQLDKFLEPILKNPPQT